MRAFAKLLLFCKIKVNYSLVIIKICISLLFFSLGYCSLKHTKLGHKDRIELKENYIGKEVDTAKYSRLGNYYMPNYLNDWIEGRVDRLPKKYSGLPVAIFVSKEDSTISLTLLDTKILNILLTGINNEEALEYIEMINNRFSLQGNDTIYHMSHPLQNWITFSRTITWEKDNVIVQIGYSYLTKHVDSIPSTKSWSLIYSDLNMEDEIIKNYNERNK